MSNKKTISHDYMSDKAHFADLVNFYFFDGEQVIRPDDLENEDEYLKKMKEEKGDSWVLTQDSVNMINTFTGAKIPIIKKGEVKSICAELQKR